MICGTISTAIGFPNDGLDIGFLDCCICAYGQVKCNVYSQAPIKWLNYLYLVHSSYLTLNAIWKVRIAINCLINMLFWNPFQDKVVSINLHLLYRPRRQRCLIFESKLEASFDTWLIIGTYLAIGTGDFWKTTGLPELGIWNILWLDRCCWNYSFLTVWKKLRNLSLCKKVFLWLWKSLF